MSKIVKNEYLSIPSVDSFKIRIPLHSLTHYHKSLDKTYIKVCPDTGEVELDLEGEPQVHKEDLIPFWVEGVPLRLGIAKNVRCGNRFEDFLYILINSKHALSNYFRGVDKTNLHSIYKVLITDELISIDWDKFLDYSLPTDIDIKIDYELLMDEYKEMLNGCAVMTKESKDRDKGCTPFNSKGNIGMSWSVRQTNKYLTNPYLKIYHKGLEMQYHSTQFYERHLSCYDIKNCFRIESTIKNKKHLQSLNKSLDLGFNKFNLRELMDLDKEKLRSIVMNSVNCHLYPRKKSISMFKNKQRLTPADSIMFSSLLAFIEDCNWTYLQVENVLLSRIENKASKSLNKKKLKSFYEDIINSKNYVVKAKKVESIFDSWGWF
tara:strand:- start:84 stop:1214 length:1131 start_codon:yes stop_codon:yes gene_type:complete